MYYVYIHTVPNGKIYVGQTKEVLRRWNNGEGYVSNEPFYRDILIYGWNNIKHEIVAEIEDRETAERLEANLIVLLKSENEHYGYNQTTMLSDAMKKYASRVSFSRISFETSSADDNLFESSNLPVSVCKELIDQWIFNEKNRNILKRRLIDGVTYPNLSKEFGISERRLKAIVSEQSAILKRHI